MIKKIFTYLFESYNHKFRFMLNKQKPGEFSLDGRLKYKRDPQKEDYIITTSFGNTNMINTLNAEKQHPAFYLLLLLNGLLGPMSVRPSSRVPLYLFMKVPMKTFVSLFDPNEDLKDYKEEVATLHDKILVEKNIFVVLLPSFF